MSFLPPVDNAGISPPLQRDGRKCLTRDIIKSLARVSLSSEFFGSCSRICCSLEMGSRADLPGFHPFQHLPESSLHLRKCKGLWTAGLPFAIFQYQGSPSGVSGPDWRLGERVSDFRFDAGKPKAEFPQRSCRSDVPPCERTSPRDRRYAHEGGCFPSCCRAQRSESVWDCAIFAFQGR